MCVVRVCVCVCCVLCVLLKPLSPAVATKVPCRSLCVVCGADAAVTAGAMESSDLTDSDGSKTSPSTDWNTEEM